MKRQRVVFRKFKGINPPDVIAFFLDQPEGAGKCTSYMSIGQHGTATYPHFGTLPATPEEYNDVLKELKVIGYNDLRIVTKGRIKQS